jgi:hypothetical protein
MRVPVATEVGEHHLPEQVPGRHGARLTSVSEGQHHCGGGLVVFAHGVHVEDLSGILRSKSGVSAPVESHDLQAGGPFTVVHQLRIHDPQPT